MAVKCFWRTRESAWNKNININTCRNWEIPPANRAYLLPAEQHDRQALPQSSQFSLTRLKNGQNTRKCYKHISQANPTEDDNQCISCVCDCVCVCRRDRQTDRQRQRDRVCVCVTVYVCVRERKRQTDRQTDSQTETDRQRERARETDRQSRQKETKRERKKHIDNTRNIATNIGRKINEKSI